ATQVEIERLSEELADRENGNRRRSGERRVAQPTPLACSLRTARNAGRTAPVRRSCPRQDSAPTWRLGTSACAGSDRLAVVNAVAAAVDRHRAGDPRVAGGVADGGRERYPIHDQVALRVDLGGSCDVAQDDVGRVVVEVGEVGRRGSEL